MTTSPDRIRTKCDQVHQVCTRCGRRKNWDPDRTGDRDMWPLGAWLIVRTADFDQRGEEDTVRDQPSAHVLCGYCAAPIRAALTPDRDLPPDQQIGLQLLRRDREKFLKDLHDLETTDVTIAVQQYFETREQRDQLAALCLRMQAEVDRVNAENGDQPC